MIQSGRASLVVNSVETAPESISAILGVDPTSSTPKGTVLRSGRIVEHNSWVLEIGDLNNTEEDSTGTRALRELLLLARPAAGRIATLPTDCDARVWWSADSDSTQGGFVLSADLAGQIAALGVDVYSTIYLEGDSEEVG